MFSNIKLMCKLFKFNLSLNVYPYDQSKCKIDQ